MLARGLDLLTCFQPGDEVLSLSAMARRVDLPLTSAHRIVGGLCRWGLLERDHGLRLGRRLLVLARPAPVHPALWSAALPYLARLPLATHLQVRLVVRQGNQTFRLGRIEPREGGLAFCHEMAPSSPTEAGLAVRTVAEAGALGRGAVRGTVFPGAPAWRAGADGGGWEVRSGCVVRADSRVAAAAAGRPDSSFALVLALHGVGSADVLPHLLPLRAAADVLGEWLEALPEFTGTGGGVASRTDPAGGDIGEVARRIRDDDFCPPPPWTMLDKAIRLLTCFTVDHPVLTVSELSAVSTLSKSTTSRLIGVMSQRQILVPHQSGFTIGTTLRSLSAMVPWHHRLIEVTRPWQRKISEATGGAVCLALVDHSHVIWMDAFRTPSHRQNQQDHCRDASGSARAGVLWRAAADAAVDAHAGAATAGADREPGVLVRRAPGVVAVPIPAGELPRTSLVATLHESRHGGLSRVAELLRSAALEIGADMSVHR
ncbi:helix-turn-helix domain-containing protein [Streptomyces ureilyticus]|uniref:Helix-turn-helix domain-containing protein n=1 Tax=Streptomyces ureilyticus TaxID=1775131 RepID=A0ABX0DI72_9ACTN|nr:helix-turn-helix domain-containing protein [Streptomyces ureilyticus]NGO41272.1 helix-turn-helix domain-containing protein [Streptomyces ureilyticus]